MNIVKKIKDFFVIRYNNKVLLLEAFIYLGWARILKSIPFSKVAPSLGDQMNETSLIIHAIE